MANLLNALQKTQTQRAQQPIPGQAANLRQALLAKSGKAGAATGPRISSVQEQQALADFETQATQQQQEGQTAVEQQQLAQQAQEQQFAQQTVGLQDKAQEAVNRYAQQVSNITNQLDRADKDLQTKESKAALNQAIFTRRLADEQYITALNRQGSLRRLEDKIQFKEAAQQDAFAQQMDLFRDQADFNRFIEMDMAEFEKEMTRMNEDFADQILKTEMEGANRTSQIAAVGSVPGLAVEALNTEYKTDSGDKTTLADEIF